MNVWFVGVDNYLSLEDNELLTEEGAKEAYLEFLSEEYTEADIAVWELVEGRFERRKVKVNIIGFEEV